MPFYVNSNTFTVVWHKSNLAPKILTEIKPDRKCVILKHTPVRDHYKLTLELETTVEEGYQQVAGLGKRRDFPHEHFALVPQTHRSQYMDLVKKKIPKVKKEPKVKPTKKPSGPKLVNSREKSII